MTSAEGIPTIVLVLALCLFASSCGEGVSWLAPLNPAFLEFQAKKAPNPRLTAEPGHALGYIRQSPDLHEHLQPAKDLRVGHPERHPPVIMPGDHWPILPIRVAFSCVDAGAEGRILIVQPCGVTLENGGVNK